MVLIVVVWRRPFLEWYKNVGLSIILLACILSNVSTYLLSQESVSDYLSYAMLILLCIYVVGVAFIIVVYGCVARCCRLPSCLRYVLLLFFSWFCFALLLFLFD